MKKVTLIKPASRSPGLINRTPLFMWPSYALLQLASLTPSDWDVEIIDEHTALIDFDSPTDLAAITAMTPLAPRAYEIASEYRKRGIPTIMGGIHASTLPQEAARYVDSVAVGEFDTMWPTVLQDAAKGRLKQYYVAERTQNLDIPPCRTILKRTTIDLTVYKLKLAFIQSQRGCPIGCKNCSVTQFNGRVIRSNSIEYTLRAIEREMESGFDFLIFINDNIVGNKRYAKKLFHALIPLKIRWMSQTDIRIADPDIIDLACKSGFVGGFFGFESIVPLALNDSVGEVKKSWRHRYEESIKRLHENGVFVHGSFMFGLDGEGPDAIETTVEWAIDNNIDVAAFAILTPFPGLELFKTMDRDGRILTRDWSKYSFSECVFQPQNYTPEELEEKVRWAFRQFYSYRSIVRRFHIPPLNPLHLFLYSLFNLSYRRFR